MNKPFDAEKMKQDMARAVQASDRYGACLDALNTTIQEIVDVLDQSALGVGAEVEMVDGYVLAYNTGSSRGLFVYPPNTDEGKHKQPWSTASALRRMTIVDCLPQLVERLKEAAEKKQAEAETRLANMKKLREKLR